MQRQQTPQEFLSSQKVIRVHIDSMPYGTGNQASSYNLMGRLRELGFKGKYEVLYYVGVNEYYPDGNLSRNKNLTKEKIINLFNLPLDLPDVYYDAEKNIEFIEGHVYYEKINKKEILHHTIAITGGQLRFCPEAAATNNKDIIKTQAQLDAISCQNDANSHEVDIHLRVEPWLGKNPSPKLNNLRIAINGAKSEISLKDADHLFFNPPKAASLKEITEFLKDPKQSIKLNNQREGLLALIEGFQQKKFHVMPFYGGPIKTEYEQVPGAAPYKMLHYIMGVKLAKNNGQRELQDKPIILPVFYDYTKESKSIKNILKEIQNGEDKYDDTLKSFIPSLNLYQCVIVKDISSKNIVETLATLSSDKIVLLSMGKLPSNVFNTLYPQLATLPPVLEGENTRNLLMAETSKPFLRSKEWFFSPYSYGPKEYYPNKTLSERYAAYDQISLPSTSDNFIKSAQWVSQFIMDSFHAQSDVCQYFHWLHEQAIKSENDRVTYILKKAISILTENKKIPLITEKPIEEKLASTNLIFQTLNKAYDAALGKMVTYAHDVVQQCPGYFNHAHSTAPADAKLMQAIGFFNINNTCVPHLPDTLQVPMLGR